MQEKFEGHGGNLMHDSMEQFYFKTFMHFLKIDVGLG